MSYPGHSLGGVVLPLCWGAVSVFYSPSRLGKMKMWKREFTHKSKNIIEENLKSKIFPQTFCANLHIPLTIIWIQPSRLGRIHRVLFCRGVRPPTTTTTTTNECNGYKINQSYGEAPVMLELWGMPSIPSLPLIPDSFEPGVVAPDSPIYGSNRTVWHLNWVKTNHLC